MGSIDIVKPLSTAVNISQQHKEKNSWECQESYLGLLGAKQECYSLRYAPHTPTSANTSNTITKTNLGYIVGKVFARVLDTADGDVQGKDLESANDHLDGSQPDEPSVRATANRNQRKRTRAPGLA